MGEVTSWLTKDWDEVLVDMENTSWEGQTIVSYDEDAEEWHNLIIRRLEVEGDTIKSLQRHNGNMETLE